MRKEAAADPSHYRGLGSRTATTILQKKSRITMRSREMLREVREVGAFEEMD